MVNIDRKQALLRELAEIEEEEKRVAALSPEHRLAEALHSLNCRWNHTDGCGWYYENADSYPTPTWLGYSHAEYLKKARAVIKLLPNFTVDQIIEVARAVK